MKGWRGFVGAAALVASLLAARPAQAGYWEDAGWGTLTMLTNVIYMPAKLVYATLGGVTGGLAFALTGGDLQPAETVWVTTMGGTYVVTPGMLQGQETIAFSGTPNGGTTTTDASDSGNMREEELSQQLGGGGS
jgi:hypothetical protein